MQVSNEVYEAELSAREGTTIEQATRTGGLGPFSGPPKLLLRAVSQGLFWYLQPRVSGQRSTGSGGSCTSCTGKARAHRGLMRSLV